MSRFVVLTLLLTTGCGGQAPRAGGGPPVSVIGHPPRGVHPALVATTLDADPELARDRRVLVLRAAAALEVNPAAEDAPRGDAVLLHEIFGGLTLESAPPPRAAVSAWVDAARVRHGRPRIGDLAIFEAVRGVPRVAVVVEVHADGLVEAVAETRAAWRRIKVHPEQRGIRRTHGRIVNTFLRTRHADDPPRSRYLAGQLLKEFRTLLD